MTQLGRVPSLFLLICLLSFPQISETIYTPSLPDLAKSFSVQMNLAELTLSIYFIGFALGVFLFGIISDLLGRRRAMLLGIGGYLLGSIGCSVSSSIYALLFCRFFQAIGASSGSVVSLTIMRDIFAGNERIRAFSFVSAALSISPAIGPFIGGLLDQTFGWKANFLFLVVIGLVLELVCIYRLPESKPTILQQRNTINLTHIYRLMKAMVADPKILSFAFLIGSCNGIIFGFYGEGPYLFIEKLQLTPSQYGLLGLIISVSFAFSSVLSQKLNQTLRPESVIFIGSFVTLLGAICMGLLCVLGVLQPNQSLIIWLSLFCSLFVLFSGVGLMIPNCLSQALSEYQDRVGTAGSILGLMYYILIASFTSILSLLHNGSILTMPFYFSCLGVGMIIIAGLIGPIRAISRAIKLGFL